LLIAIIVTTLIQVSPIQRTAVLSINSQVLTLFSIGKAITGFHIPTLAHPLQTTATQALKIADYKSYQIPTKGYEQQTCSTLSKKFNYFPKDFFSFLPFSTVFSLHAEAPRPFPACETGQMLGFYTYQ